MQLPLLLLHGLCALVVAQGDMHPSIGMPAGCPPQRDERLRAHMRPTIAPSFGGRQAQSRHTTHGLISAAGNDPTGNRCARASSRTPIRAAGQAGLLCRPKFNTIIGVCQGASCACGSSSTQAPSCAHGRRRQMRQHAVAGRRRIPGSRVPAVRGPCSRATAGSWSSRNAAAGACTGESVACYSRQRRATRPFYDAGTRATVNYFAAYQYDEAAGHWCNGRRAPSAPGGALPPFDLMKPYGGLPKERRGSRRGRRRRTGRSATTRRAWRASARRARCGSCRPRSGGAAQVHAQPARARPRPAVPYAPSTRAGRRTTTAGRRTPAR